MKIAFLNHFISGGGAERVTCLLADKMQERGHEVILMTDLYHPFAYKVSSGIKKIPLFRNKVESRSKISLWYMIRSTRAMLKSDVPDVIIGVLPMMNLVAILAAQGLKTKVVASHHTSFDRRENIHIRLIKNFVYRWADAVTILTQADYDYLGKRLPKKMVMPNPLAYPCLENKVSTRKKSILAVGRLDVWEVKGFDLLIKAWGMIAKDYPNWRLEIAGGGKEESVNDLRRIAEENDVKETVDFLGFRNDMDNLMRKSSIFVLSSRVEGFGMVLIEAMSQGCACISFDDGGRQREIITSEREGVIIDGHDIRVLAKALQELICDEGLRKRISQGGIDRAKMFDVDRIEMRWEELIKQLTSTNANNNIK